MFNLAQIKEAHSKVKTGADFPAYIQDMKGLGVTHYETFVFDGHTVYQGHDGTRLDSGAKYEPMEMSAQPDAEQFKKDLTKHQGGGSDYTQFIHACAANGVEKWTISIEKMTCTYFNKAGGVMLEEHIPG